MFRIIFVLLFTSVVGYIEYFYFDSWFSFENGWILVLFLGAFFLDVLIGYIFFYLLMRYKVLRYIFLFVVIYLLLLTIDSSESYVHNGGEDCFWTINNKLATESCFNRNEIYRLNPMYSSLFTFYIWIPLKYAFLLPLTYSGIVFLIITRLRFIKQFLSK